MYQFSESNVREQNLNYLNSVNKLCLYVRKVKKFYHIAIYFSLECYKPLSVTARKSLAEDYGA